MFLACLDKIIHIEYIFNMNNLEEIKDLTPLQRFQVMTNSDVSSKSLEKIDNDKVRINLSAFEILRDYSNYPMRQDETQRIVSKANVSSSYFIECTDIIQALLIELLEIAKLNIEIKPTGHETDFEKNVIDIVKANGFENDCMLASLDIEALKKVKEIDPNIKTLYDMTVAAGNISEMTFIDGFSIEETFIDYDIVDQIHQNNKKVFVWTVNEPSNIINICKYDIDNILTDDPLTAREVINEEKLSDSTVDFVNLFFKEEMRTQYINQ